MPLKHRELVSITLELEGCIYIFPAGAQGGHGRARQARAWRFVFMWVSVFMGVSVLGDTSVSKSYLLCTCFPNVAFQTMHLCHAAAGLQFFAVA